MEYTILGKSDLHISRIAMGCMSLGSDPAAIERLLHRAIDGGINFFDTADLYDKGQNEERIGAVLKPKRKDVILATKVGNQWREDGSGWDWNPRKEYILESVENSLRRLQTDYIDLYQLHGGTLDDPIEETIEAFEQLKQQGKIRWYGISSIRPNVIREWVKRSGMVSVMMQYSLLDRRPEEESLHLLQQQGMGVLARGSVASGLLIDKPAKPYLDYSADKVRSAAAAVKAVSDEGRQPAQTAIQFVLQNPAISSAVVGIRTVAQLEDALQAASAKKMVDQDYHFLQNSIPVNQYAQHR